MISCFTFYGITQLPILVNSLYFPNMLGNIKDVI